MRNGVYRVRFETPSQKGSGVIILNDGHFSGGDKTHFFSGNYTEANNRFSGVIRFKRHGEAADFKQVVERDVFHVHVDGICSETYAQVDAWVPEVAGERGHVTCMWMCEA
jgi:hypothetical protein